MDAEEELREAIGLVWRNLTSGPSTFAACACGRMSARGGGPCLKCAHERLALVAGEGRAAEYVKAVRRVRELETRMLESVISP